MRVNESWRSRSLSFLVILGLLFLLYGCRDRASHAKDGHEKGGKHVHSKHDGHEKGGKHDDHDDHDDHDARKGRKKGEKGHDAHRGHKEGDKGDGERGGHDGHRGEVKLGAEALKRLGLRSERLRLEELKTQQISAVGRVSLPPSQISRVGSRVEGRILRWYVRLGQRVKRGQGLVLLDSPSVGRARANYLRRHALHRLEMIEHQRAKKLKRIGLTSAKKLLASSISLRKADIDLRSAQAQLRILGVPVPAQKKLEQLTGSYVLRAPASGEVTATPHALGAWVSPRDTILRLEDRQKVWILLEIYARDLPFVEVGQEVHLYGPGLPKHLEGKISYLASRFERGAQTLEARVELSNKGGKLRPNQFIYAMIQSGGRVGREVRKLRGLLLPEDAVQRVGRGEVVFVEGDRAGHFRVRRVVTVEAPDGRVRVLYGLSAGERVVVKGSFVLKSELMRSSLEGGHGHSH